MSLLKLCCKGLLKRLPLCPSCVGPKSGPRKESFCIEFLDGIMWFADSTCMVIGLDCGLEKKNCTSWSNVGNLAALI